MELGKVLQPLIPYREKLLFLRGLYNEEARIGGIHSCQTGNLLTGAHLANGGEIRSGISMDQVVARRFANETKVDSLVLGCEHSTNQTSPVRPTVYRRTSMSTCG